MNSAVGTPGRNGPRTRPLTWVFAGRWGGPRLIMCSDQGAPIETKVGRLPGGGDPLPLWIWSSATGLNSEDVDVRWQTFLRRFDIEHLSRLMKQTLAWTRPKLRTPAVGERWTWLIIAAHTQIRLASAPSIPPSLILNSSQAWRRGSLRGMSARPRQNRVLTCPDARGDLQVPQHPAQSSVRPSDATPSATYELAGPGDWRGGRPAWLRNPERTPHVGEFGVLAQILGSKHGV